MRKSHNKTKLINLFGLSLLLALGGCNQSSNSEKKVEIKPAPKQSNDATAYAKQAWHLMNQVEPLVVPAQKATIDDQVRKPLRELGIAWKINVKMTDSVTEGKYALCRKALTSLDTWARAVKEADPLQADLKQSYLNDKAECKDALDHPSLGNTSPN
ncbi:hypothetical protein [Acinetobacter sp. MD2(2019)]|uniref:hypothetical protein n=1 Tax=Acinetobacter sp. MD2(2019) TaxID=2605273 RepID=UPI002D1E6103|nr:hypothetical protein [Acinetobacter sp. MD2(2019)]MEB3753866.1 hypothetical protein [Acinetobacter sp. MD2(2019)]